MVKISKAVGTIAIVVLVAAIIAGINFYQKQNQVSLQQVVPAKLPQRAKGNPQAKIKIIEFIDFQCPACAKGYELIGEYLKKYPEKLYVELRYFPLSMHKHGVTSARWGECAARQEKFWPFMDLLLARQNDWASLEDPLPPYRATATEAGVDLDVLKECLKDESLGQVINADMEEGKMRAVSSTPTYFINHEMVVGTKSLKTKLDELLGIKTEDKNASEAKP